jgi:hypothetical protein
MSVTTWNLAPDYDQWGSDTYWSCNEWILWHQYLKNKFGQTKANFLWDYAFSQSGTLSKNLDCRTFDSKFRDYVKSNGLNPFASAGIFTPVLQGAGTIQDVTSGIFGGISSFFTSGNFKTFLNVMSIGAVVVGGLYVYRTFKK